MSLSVQDVSLFAGVLLSLLFSYIPGVKEWYDARSTTKKRLVMLAALVATVGGAALSSCLGFVAFMSCEKTGFIEMAKAFIGALVANQATYLVTPKVHARIDIPKKVLLVFLPLPFLFFASPVYAEPPYADTFPGDEIYCLAATVHTEAANQSEAAKSAIARWVLVRAIEKHETVCTSLRSDRTIAAAYAPEGSWAWDVYRNGDLLRRLKGAESYRIATEVYDRAGEGEQYDHFDSCDSPAGWTARYERVRLVENDDVCFWR